MEAEEWQAVKFAAGAVGVVMFMFGGLIGYGVAAEKYNLPAGLTTEEYNYIPVQASGPNGGMRGNYLRCKDGVSLQCIDMGNNQTVWTHEAGTDYAVGPTDLVTVEPGMHYNFPNPEPKGTIDIQTAPDKPKVQYNIMSTKHWEIGDMTVCTGFDPYTVCHTEKAKRPPK